MKLRGVTSNLVIKGLDIIAVVTPVETLSIGLPSVLWVVTVKESVVAVVLGFYKPSNITVKEEPNDV